MSEVQQVEFFFYRTLQQFPTHIAIKVINGKEITYRELDQLVERYVSILSNHTIEPGDHIALALNKTIETVAWILACLRCKAVYIPIDISSPLKRQEEIIQECEAKLILSTKLLGENFKLTEEIDGVKLYAQPSVKRTSAAIENGAYILYTSGSTGRPKGVIHTHQSAYHFVNWSTTTFSPQADDIIASIAPFHFDLSIFDLFASLGSGAKLLLINEEVSRNPKLLAQTLAQEQVSICYTTPTLLSLLLKYGNLERHNFSYLKQVLFAGEVFQPKQLHQLMQLCTEARFFNLYGPTETNVCTYYPIPVPINKNRIKPYPIGSVISGVKLRLEEEKRNGNLKELWISGNSLMKGYWNASKEEENIFVCDTKGTKWYNTGDLVSKDADGNLVFHGRKDRMVKRNGYRIELSEIERAIAIHPNVVDTIVVSINATGKPKLKAFLESSADISIIAIKTHCATYLPAYMMPDEFHFIESIPQTSNHKVDVNQLITL